jgi:proton-coupled amino acid transporter
MLLRANRHGLEEPPVTSTFIDFLYLFGHFAGEDLEEETDDDGLSTIDEESEIFVSPIQAAAGPSSSILRRTQTGASDRPFKTVRTVDDLSSSGLFDRTADETTPLISDSTLQRRSRSRKRSLSRQRRSRLSSRGPHGDATVTQAILMVCLTSIHCSSCLIYI